MRKIWGKKRKRQLYLVTWVPLMQRKVIAALWTAGTFRFGSSTSKVFVFICPLGAKLEKTYDSTMGCHAQHPQLSGNGCLLQNISALAVRPRINIITSRGEIPTWPCSTSATLTQGSSISCSRIAWGHQVYCSTIGDWLGGGSCVQIPCRLNAQSSISRTVF